MDGSVLLLSEDLQDLQEELDDVDVQQNRSKHIIIQCQFLILPSQNELRIDDKVDAIDTGDGYSHEDSDEITLDEENVDDSDAEGHEEETPEEALITTYVPIIHCEHSVKSASVRIAYRVSPIVAAHVATAACNTLSGVQKEQITDTMQDSQRVKPNSMISLAGARCDRPLQQASGRMKQRDPTNATQKSHIFWSWKAAQDGLQTVAVTKRTVTSSCMERRAQTLLMKPLLLFFTKDSDSQVSEI